MHEGNYSLIMVEPQDSKAEMAFLDVEGDTFELAPEEGTSEKARFGGLSAGQAIMKADEGLTGSGVMLKAITGDGGVVIGYEVYPPASQGPGPPSGPETETVLLPNLLRIDYAAGPTGRPRVRIITLPLKNPEGLMPAQ